MNIIRSNLERRNNTIMIMIPNDHRKEFKMIYDQHRSINLSMQILYDHIKLLTMKHKVMDRATYREFYFNICKDVKLETPPMEIFIPGDDEHTISINRDIPEWGKLKRRITKDDLFETLPMTHPVYIYAKDNIGAFEVLIDDALIHWSTFKYLEEIEKLLMSSYMNGTPLIEWMCGGDAIMDEDGNIKKESILRGMPIDTFRQYMRTDKINTDKIYKQGRDDKNYMYDICFKPNLLRCKEFYLQMEKEGEPDFTHFQKLGLKPFDAEDLLLRIASNIEIKTDRFILLGVYLILSFSIPDILNIEKFGGNIPPCVKYIQEVLSVI